jgi:hypothetical protein
LIFPFAVYSLAYLYTTRIKILAISRWARPFKCCSINQIFFSSESKFSKVLGKELTDTFNSNLAKQIKGIIDK